nr:hypothetical protein BaRGS_035049 [Batillaria attramentaria]
MQDKTTRLEATSAGTGLKINRKKTELMKINTTANTPVTVGGEPIREVESFVYLGSVVDGQGGTDRDVTARIGKARAAMVMLKNVWASKVVSIRTKLRIFNSNVKSVLLYGCETWRTTKTMQQKIQTFLNTCLRRIFNIRWPEKIRNEELWERAGQEPVAKQILRRKWGWIGHTLRKPASSTTRQALTWNPQGKRKRGRPRNSWRRDTEAELCKQGTNWTGVARLAQNRVRWRRVVDGLCSTWSQGPKFIAHLLWVGADLGENRDVTKVKKRQLRKTAAKYTIREDVLYHDGILVAKRNQVPEILQEFHDNYVSGGHLGMNKTYKKVLERYFWHGMKQEVEDYCRSCCVCQNMNACRKKPAAPLHPIPVPKKKWSLVGMDIIGPLQVTDRGNQYIVALTDHFTKFPVAKAIPCKSSEEVARFMYETICIFGAFDSLITDQGREFINFALDILTDRFNINHRISSAYHPETNGQRERDNRTLKDTLVKITDNDDWDELLPAALFAYRTSVHKSTQFSPFLALYGEQAKLPFDVTGDANEQDLNEEIMDTMKGIHEEVKNKIGENISRAQKKQKEYYDSRRAYDHGFRIGDKVLIINAARVHRMGGKMAPRFVGPYESHKFKFTVTYQTLR